MLLPPSATLRRMASAQSRCSRCSGCHGRREARQRRRARRRTAARSERALSWDPTSGWASCCSCWGSHRRRPRSTPCSCRRRSSSCRSSRRANQCAASRKPGRPPPSALHPPPSALRPPPCPQASAGPRGLRRWAPSLVALSGVALVSGSTALVVDGSTTGVGVTLSLLAAVKPARPKAADTQAAEQTGGAAPALAPRRVGRRRRRRRRGSLHLMPRSGCRPAANCSRLQ